MDEKEKARKIKAFQERIAYLEANINKLTDLGKWDLEYSKTALKCRNNGKLPEKYIKVW